MNPEAAVRSFVNERSLRARHEDLTQVVAQYEAALDDLNSVIVNLPRLAQMVDVPDADHRDGVARGLSLAQDALRTIMRDTMVSRAERSAAGVRSFYDGDIIDIDVPTFHPDKGDKS